MKTIHLVVNGQPHSVDVIERAPLSHVVLRALHETNNLGGRTPSEWLLMTTRGVLLEQSLLVLDLNTESTFFLSLPPGFGG